MTYLYRVLRDNPVGFWPLDANINSDVSGYSRNLTVTGSPVATRPIVARGRQSTQVASSDLLTYPVPNIMVSGKHNQPFTLEAWFRVDSVGVGNVVVRNASGLSIDGNNLTFTVKMGTAVSATWPDLEPGFNYYTVAVYDTEDVYLYVNGQLVASSPISSDNMAAGFEDTAATLKTNTTGTLVMTLDSLAVYPSALDSRSVDAHYAWGTDYPISTDIALRNGANTYLFWDGASSVMENTVIDTAAYWNGGMTSAGAGVIDDTLRNLYDEVTGQFLDGTWSYSFSYEPESTVLEGSRLTWNTNVSNLLVEISTDGGLTWNEIVNGGEPFSNQSLTVGFEMILRVSLAAGSTQTIVTNINYIAYKSKNIRGGNEDIPAVMVDEQNVMLAEYDLEPTSFDGNAGAYFTSSTSGLSIDTDPEFGSYGAVELSIRQDLPNANKTLFEGSGASLTINSSGSWVAAGIAALYVDGVSQSVGAPMAVINKQPHHVIIVPSTPIAGTIYVGNNAAGTAGLSSFRVSYLGTYPNTISASDAVSIYKAWVGDAVTRITDSSSVVVKESNYTESGRPMRAYTFDWSISHAD